MVNDPPRTTQRIGEEQTPRQQLALEIGVLRKQAREAARNYFKQLDIGLAQILEAARGDHDVTLTQEAARDILEALHALSLKPAKGRRKDLRNVARFLKKARKVIGP